MRKLIEGTAANTINVKQQFLAEVMEVNAIGNEIMNSDLSVRDKDRAMSKVLNAFFDIQIRRNQFEDTGKVIPPQYSLEELRKVIE